MGSGDQEPTREDGAYAYGCVLFATAAEPPEASVRRAADFAIKSGLGFQALQIMRPRLRVRDVLDPSRDLRAFARFVHIARTSTGYFAHALGQQFAEDHLAIRVGEFFSEVIEQTRQVDASVIAIAAGELSGKQVTQLVRATLRPVLVAYPEPSLSRPIVAATDLASPEYPVLRQARAIGALADAEVVAIHNAPRSRLQRVLSVRARVAAGALARDLSAELDRVSLRMEVDSAVLLHTRDCADAILSEARARSAGMIVVGTHLRSSLLRFQHKSIAAAIIDRARRSVLVEPIVARGASEPAPV